MICAPVQAIAAVKAYVYAKTAIYDEHQKNKAIRAITVQPKIKLKLKVVNSNENFDEDVYI